MHFTSAGGHIANTKDGSKIDVQLKNGVYIIKLWVKTSGKP